MAHGVRSGQRRVDRARRMLCFPAKLIHRTGLNSAADSRKTTPRSPDVSLRSLTPPDRIAALVDRDSMGAVDAALHHPRPSPHLGRWDIRAQDDDGIVTARASLQGRVVF